MKKIRRLKKNQDFQVVFNKGKSIANRQFVVYVLAQQDKSFARLGLSVSKKMGNAVMRNHIKRLIKESFREFSEELELGNDYIIISRRPVRTMSYHEFQGSLRHVLKKAGVMTD
ncbi:MAG: ribonuclease P protein component [Sporolactobacillus sp.]